MHLTRILSFPALVASLVACNMDDSSAGGTSSAKLEDTEWRLVSIAGDAIPEGVSATLTLDTESGRIAGNSGCNRYSGGYSLEGETLSTGMMISTKMACPGPAMEVETRFLKAFSDIKAYSIDGDTLTIETADGALTFRKQQ